MSTKKQWVPNKVEGNKSRSVSYPFDGGLISSNASSTFFQFNSPGLINGAFPSNMWDSTGSLLKLQVPAGDKKWFLIAECTFNTALVDATLVMKEAEPTVELPIINACPSSANIIMWAGVGVRKAWKVCKGNLLIKPMLVLRNYKTSGVQCGEIPFEDHYVMIGHS